MSGYIDLDYISKIQPRLQQFKRKEIISIILDVLYVVILKRVKQKQEHICIE